MLRWARGAILGAAIFLFGAGAAAADEELRYGPPPAWVKVAAVETPPAATEADGAFRIVHFDTQVRYGPDGDDYYLDRAIQVLTRQGLEGLGTVGQVWRPGTQSLTINKVEIIRDGQVIDALATGDPFVLLRQETNLAQAMLNGQLTATKQLEDLRVGDIVRVATTTRDHDPMVRGHSQFAAALAPEVPPIGYMRQRHLWPADKPMKWRAGEAFPKPALTRTADGFELAVEARAVKAPVMPVGAPDRYWRESALILTDFASWREVSALFAADYAAAATLKPDSPLKAEVEAIRQAHASPVDRASAALALVQERVRYLALAMGVGGFKPADADQTWSRKFGDCKGKSALLMALLKELGIDAEIVAVAIAGDDGYEDMQPRLAFDHVIVRAEIDGKTYWLDATRQGDGPIERLATPGYRWVLPVRAGGADLEEIRQVQRALPDSETVVEADYSAGLDLDAPLKLRITYRGDEAAMQHALLSGPPRSEAEAALKERWSTDNWLIDKAAFGRAEDGTVWVEATGKLRQMWTRQGARRELEAPYSSVSTDFDEREPGAIEPKAPYAVPFPLYDRYVTRIRLPRGGEGFEIIGPDVNIKAAGQWVVRRARLENGVVIVEEDDRTTGPEISFAEATSGPDRLAASGATKDVVIRAPADFRMTAGDAEAVVAERPGRDAYLLRADASMTAGAYDKALEDLNRVLEGDPADVPALSRRASILGERKDFEGALRDIAAAMVRAPGDVGLLGQRAYLYLAMDKPDLALADAEAAVAAAPGDYRAWMARAQMRDRSGDRAGSIADVDKAVTLAPDNLPLRQVQIFNTYRAPGDGEARKAAFEKLYAERIEAAPEDAERYLQRADYRADNDNLPGALEDFAKAIALKPTPQAYIARADAYRQARDRPKAIADMDRAVRLDEGATSLVARARYNSMEGTPAQWLSDARLAVAKAPQDLAALEEVARAGLVAGDPVHAREAAEEIVRLKPGDLEGLRLRALVKEKSGDLAGAVADMRRALEGPAAATPAGRSARWRLADLLGLQGDHAGAIAVLSDLQKDYPQEAEIAGRICRIKATRNVEAATAPADCDAALALSPQDADYLDSLGFANLRLGRFDHARAAYDEALTIRPGQTTTLYGRALAREGAGDLQGAREDARLAARFNHGGIREMSAYGLVPRDEGVVQALAGSAVDEGLKAHPKDAVIKRPSWGGTPPVPAFPERASDADREGRVWLRCVVMSGGQMVNCRIENEWPQDFEFGEIMLKATKDMRMQPMTVNGEAVDGAEVRFSTPFMLY